jgi:hypothetical protein
MTSVVKEKRKTPRMQPYIVPCLLLEGEEGRAGYLTDLSSRGGRAVCEGGVPAAGASVVLEFRIGRQVESSRIKAEVKWVKGSVRGMRAVGLRFERIPPAERKALEALVEGFRRRAAEIGQA